MQDGDLFIYLFLAIFNTVHNHLSHQQRRKPGSHASED